MWNLTYGTNEHLQNRNRTVDIENRLLVAKRMVLGEGWSGRLGLADVTFYV